MKCATWLLVAAGSILMCARGTLGQTTPRYLSPRAVPPAAAKPAPTTYPTTPAPAAAPAKPAPNPNTSRSPSRPNGFTGFYWGWRYPSYTVYDPYYGPYDPYAYGPIMLSPDALYGTRPIQQLMGIDQWFTPSTPAPRTNNRTVRLREVPDPPAPRERPQRAARGGDHDAAAAQGGNNKPAADDAARNDNATALAWKFIGFGDAHFAGQKYVDANERYRKATKIAPQLAAAHFRQGFALASMGRYDLAVAAIKRGLELDPDWPNSEFRVSELYDDNNLAKTAHLDALAKAAEDAPENADLLLLVGIHLWFDGQKERAKPFFDRVRQLKPDEQAMLKGFAK